MSRFGLKRFQLLLVCTAVAFVLPSVLFGADTVPPGHIDWHEWSFDYSVRHQTGGLTLENVRFKSVLVIRKASLPVIRVQYDYDAAGPFADLIPNDTACGTIGRPHCLSIVSKCDAYVCIQS